MSDEEWVDIKKHPRDGFDMFKGFKDSPLHILYETARVLVAHHEWKSEGYYPRSSDIPVETERRTHDADAVLSSQMLAAADMFDALCYPRVYKKAFPYETVELILRKDYKGNPLYVTQLLGRFNKSSQQRTKQLNLEAITE